jgi:hypothetical protein
MWAAFKLLPWASKLAIIGVIIAAFLLTIGSTYYVAYNKGTNVAAVQLERYQTASARLMAAINKSQSIVNERVLVRYVDRVQYVDRTVTQTKTIVRDAVPQQFKFSKGWVYAHNQAVKNLPVDPILASDASPASVSDVDALADTIVPNYGVCHANQAQLDELQNWVKETNEAREKAINSQ